MSILNPLRACKRQLIYGLEDLKNFPEAIAPDTAIVNETEIRVVGLRRVGNHAIINWLQRQGEAQGKTWHLNNLPVNRNPYRFLYEHYPKEKLRREAARQFEPKRLLTYSYEDYSVQQVASSFFERRHDLYLGKSQQRFDVVILRDPFNWLASRFQKGFFDVKPSHFGLMDLWLNHAREYLNETQNLPQTKVAINYNRWTRDREYRREIAEQLGLEFTDAGFNAVRQEGGGSSFDGLAFQGDASKMNLSGRWQKFADDPRYRAHFQRSDVWDYASEIFGPDLPWSRLYAALSEEPVNSWSVATFNA